MLVLKRLLKLIRLKAFDHYHCEEYLSYFQNDEEITKMLMEDLPQIISILDYKNRFKEHSVQP